MNALLSPRSIQESAKARDEPDWLVELRVEALARYAALEAPQWRRTDLSGLDIEATAWKGFTRQAAAKGVFAKAEAAVSSGHGFTSPSPAGNGAEGLVHLPLAAAAREHPELVKTALALSPRADKWEALQAALWTEGSLLFVEKATEIPEPLEAPLTLPPEGGITRDLLVMGPRSKANVLARVSGGGKGALALSGFEAHLQEGSNLTLSSVQDIDHAATLLAWRRATLHRDARLAWVDGQFGAGKSVIVNENLLEGVGSAVHYIGAFFGSAGQHMDITTAALHGAPHTDARLDMKGALNDDGYSANYSIVFIGPAAKNSSGHQHQETLVLSEGARADAIPKLDVENNEVSASHGATVGQVDPEQLFYLRSRGFTQIAAKRLIVEGFFEPLLAKIPVESVRDEIRGAIVERMKG
jgi:Fe-S cluster assembly scaffold protein SufB